ncbi:hypothetical protein ONZ45_g944 [Pleurotus djamor]|nr:hypothetical protein ONZ45_g944 [Pleurotus djamor]
MEKITFAVSSLLLACGTVYSIAYNTYLDTSNPLLTNLPHPLQASHYFANKSNILNVLFIKRAWGWTSLAFFALFATSPRRIRTVNRFVSWIAATLVWVAFTGWFFGPALLERVIVASGGECMVSLPSGEALSVPHQYCYTKTTITTDSHPHLFTSTDLLPGDWRGRPRLRKGHDVSGHIFLLIMSLLFLANQLNLSLRVNSSSWSPFHQIAVGATLALIAAWLLAVLTTAVYFHSPFEKVTGYFLGLAGYVVTTLFD